MDRAPRAPEKPVAYEVARVLVSRDRISRRLDRLAAELVEHYGRDEVTILAILTGAFVFVADLVRRLEIPLEIEVAQVSSYPGTAVSAQGPPRFTLPGPANLAGRRVLIADDILDSGATLSALIEDVRSAGAAETRTCVLLRKRRSDLPDRPDADFVGFDIPDEFVVGYGLDHDNRYRNLPDIRVLRPVCEAEA